MKMAKKGKGQKGPVNPRKSSVAKIPKEHTFHVDFYSEQEDKQYEGWFTVKKPSMMTQMSIEGRKSELLGGKYYDPSLPGRGVPYYAGMIAEAMAFLEHTVSDAPDWWDLEELSDLELLFLVYEEAAVIDPFREPENDAEGDGKSDGDSGAESRPEHDGPDLDDRLEALVDEEIPTSHYER